MKKLTNIFCSILISFLTLSLVGCSTKGIEEYKAENVIKKYVNTYYTIDKNDMEVYKKIIAGFKQKDLMELVAITKSAEEKFKPLMTDTAYEELRSSRMSYGRVKDANDKKYYVTVKNIKLEKYAEDKEKQMLVYYYDIELSHTYISGHEIKSVKARKQITVLKVENSWRVGYFDIN